MASVKFESLGLSENIMKAVSLAGYETPTPIQERAIPEVLAGRDVFGCAQTGTGKTAAFVLPILQKIGESGKYPAPKEFRALILTPTRELAEQISSNVALYSKFCNIKHAKVYGGVSEKPQIKSLASGADILVATPGRLLDLYHQRALKFNAVEFFVLDEADRMLDMGFIHDVQKICAMLPQKRQTLLFSATLSDEVKSLASNLVVDPVKIAVSPEKPTVDKIAQTLCFVETVDKQSLLEHMMKERLERNPEALALVFSRTKHGANKIVKKLASVGLMAGVIHGNKSQSARTRALEEFKSHKSHILVATDIAARGIDVKDMSLVVNFDLPEECETYVHRIGRTARAEAEGEAVSFCAPTEVALLRDIERLIKMKIPENPDNPFRSENAARSASSRNPDAEARRAKAERSRGSRDGRGNGRFGGGQGGRGGRSFGGRRGGDFQGTHSVSRDERSSSRGDSRGEGRVGKRTSSAKGDSPRADKFNFKDKPHSAKGGSGANGRGHFGVKNPKGGKKGFWKSVADKFTGR